MKDLGIYCAGGFGREIYCLIFKTLKSPDWNFVGFLMMEWIKANNFSMAIA